MARLVLRRERSPKSSAQESETLMVSMEIFSQGALSSPPAPRLPSRQLNRQNSSSFERQLTNKGPSRLDSSYRREPPRDELSRAPQRQWDKPVASRQTIEGTGAKKSSPDQEDDQVRGDTDPQMYSGPIPWQAPLATNSSEVLSNINKLYDTPSKLTMGAPILALLTGQLEKLNPAEIPQLVTNNALIQNAMSYDDIQQFFSTPVPITQLVSDLGFRNIAHELSSMFVLDPMVSPEQAFEALGLDSQNVLNELRLLKGYLATEGLNPYMVRAAALGAQMGSALENEEGDKLGQLSQKTNSDVSLNLKNTVDQAPSVPSIPLSPWELGTYDNTELAYLMTGVASAEAQTATTEAGPALANSDLMAAFQAPSSNATRDLATPLMGEIPGSQQGAKDLATPSVSQATGYQPYTGQIPLAETVQQDPFLTMQNQWSKSQVVDFENKLQSAPQELGHVLEQIARERTLMGPAITGGMADQPIEDNTSNVNDESRFLQFDSPDDTLAKLSQKIFDGQPMDSSSDDGQDQSSDFFSNDSSDWNPNTGSTAQTSSLNPFEIEIQAEPKVKARENLRNVVFERAHMMLKDGGGSIRLDLGTMNLGRIDLALDINQDTLRLRITADSDKAREMLTQELPALRQALLDQSLDLKTVEIGLRSQEQWSQSQQDSQQQQQEQQFQRADELMEKSGPQGWERMKKTVTSQMRSTINRPHSGNIQIRV